MSNERSQFTCYRSFYEAIRQFKNKTDRLQAFDVLMAYALDGVEPDMDKLSDAVKSCFLSIKPSLQRGRNMALARRRRINGD